MIDDFHMTYSLSLVKCHCDWNQSSDMVKKMYGCVTLLVAPSFTLCSCRALSAPFTPIHAVDKPFVVIPHHVNCLYCLQVFALTHSLSLPNCCCLCSCLYKYLIVSTVSTVCR